MKFSRLHRLKKMYQKAKRMFSFDKNRKINSNSLPKPTRRKGKAICGVESQDDTPWRFSYVRASNSLRRYGNKSRSYSAGDGSLGSSREDLLDPPLLLSRRKKLNVTNRLSNKYKSGNSSSEDLLYESDYTEEPLSSGMPETDGSVFSSQENLFKPKSRCSANVSQFLRRHSSDKTRKGPGTKAHPRSASPHIKVEFHHSTEGRHDIDDSTSLSPSKEEKENCNNIDHQQLQPLSAAGSAAVSERSMCTVSEPVLSDNTWPIRHRVHMAVVKTIQRLGSHINNMREQIENLEDNCIVLKDKLCNLREDHDALEVKITSLEERCQWYSDSKDHKYKEDNIVSEGCIPSADQVNRDSINGKTLLNQMNSIKKKSHRPSLFNLLAILLVTAVVWDIRSAGSFRGSKLGQTIERLGLTPYMVTAGEYARAAFIHSYRWCATNLPVYYSRGCELAGPYLLLMLEKIEWILAYCWAAMDSATQYIPPLKEKIEATLPGATASLSYYGGIALQSLQDGFLYLQNASSPYLTQAHAFVSSRIFVGPLAPEKLQEYVVGAAEYVSQLFLQLHAALVSTLEEANSSTKTS